MSSQPLSVIPERCLCLQQPLPLPSHPCAFPGDSIQSSGVSSGTPLRIGDGKWDIYGSSDGGRANPESRATPNPVSDLNLGIPGAKFMEVPALLPAMLQPRHIQWLRSPSQQECESQGMLTTPECLSGVGNPCTRRNSSHGRQLPAEQLPEHPRAGTAPGQAPFQSHPDAPEQPRCFLEFLLALTWLSRCCCWAIADLPPEPRLQHSPFWALSVRGFRFL